MDDAGKIIIVIIIFVGILLLFIRAGQSSPKDYICTSCGYQGSRKKTTKGSIGIEIILWLLFIIPGVLYSLWRLSSQYKGCPKCGKDSMIPLDSPIAQNLLKSFQSNQQNNIDYNKEITKLALKLADCPADSSEAREIRSEIDRLKILSQT